MFPNSAKKLFCPLEESESLNVILEDVDIPCLSLRKFLLLAVIERRASNRTCVAKNEIRFPLDQPKMFLF